MTKPINAKWVFIPQRRIPKKIAWMAKPVFYPTNPDLEKALIYLHDHTYVRTNPGKGGQEWLRQDFHN